MARAWLLIGALLIAVVATPALAQKPSDSGYGTGSSERIHRFASDIIIEQDGDLVVTETIELTALGREIRRGPYRDFPTRYRDRQGNQMRVGFDVLEVLRDGRPERWHRENLPNGVRIYVGQEDVFLSPGRYTYTIRYRTTRQLGYFEDHDELYFNVTGHGWSFPIDVAEATVHLPNGAEPLEALGFTGRFGADGRAFQITRRQPGLVAFRTTSTLRPQEGLTILVAWPKGLVAEPSGPARAGYFFADNVSLLIAVLGLIAVFAYYRWAWRRVGKDPATGTIIPLFEPPEGFSPAATRFVDRMGFDQKAFTAAIINMAVKGFLTIEEDGKTFRLVKASGDASVLSPGEKKIGNKLLGTRSSIKLKQSHHSIFSSAISGLKSSLKREYEATNFLRNTQYLIPGVGLSVITLVLMGIAAPSPADTLLALAWLAGWSTFGMIMLFSGWESLSGRQSLAAAFGSIAMFVVGILMMASGTIFFWVPELLPGWVLIFPVGAMVLLTPIYFELLKAPTKKGRKVMDEIDGFRQFLSVAERHRLESFHPPENTPELFEKFLPYALALDVENKWSEQFDDVLKTATVDGVPYHPVWYHGGHWHRFGAHGFAGAVSSAVTSSIASAATAPGSSSGVGRGGFSGGGGGGGGGGGW